MSGRTRKANCYVKRALCQAARAASHTRNTYLSAFCRRLCVRKGAPKAVMALAHHLITIVHHVLARQEEYVELGGDYDDRRNKTKVVNRLVKRLAVLGNDITLNPTRPLEFEEAVPAAPPWMSSPALASRTATIGADKPKRGRPCKCAERGIICIHRTVFQVPVELLDEAAFLEALLPLFSEGVLACRAAGDLLGLMGASSSTFWLRARMKFGVVESVHAGEASFNHRPETMGSHFQRTRSGLFCISGMATCESCTAARVRMQPIGLRWRPHHSAA
jgi:hypothetical protein